ncbi:MAG: D-alanyl-D-alanine carboxypeptidase [Alicyclobacillus sp.]|nr:D-alanyl-D-alanine carboxypeptidase [Alicyclobacillus sp.]
MHAPRLRLFTPLCLAVALLAGVAATSPGGPATSSSAPRPVVLNQQQTEGIPMVTHPIQPQPDIVSAAAVVMDMETGTVVYAKNPLAPHYPASITKIMTALLALQRGHLNDTLTASADAVNQPPDKLYLVPGERKTLEQFLYGLLIISANDAAVVIAEHYGGSVAGFAHMMNDEAQQLGAVHTHFTNPNGLPDPNHVTCAYDMALITQAAMQYPEFRKIVATRSYEWQGDKWQARLDNLNRMLTEYPGAIGVKTGFTSVAHNTLVVAAQRNGETFLAVLLDCPTNGQIRQDASKLLNYAFSHYQTQTLLQKGAVVGEWTSPQGQHVPLTAATDMVATVPTGVRLEPSYQLSLHQVPARFAMHDPLGQVNILLNGQPVTSLPALAGAALDPPASVPARNSATAWATGGGFAACSVLLLTLRRLRRRRVFHG